MRIICFLGDEVEHLRGELVLAHLYAAGGLLHLLPDLVRLGRRRRHVAALLLRRLDRHLPAVTRGVHVQRQLGQVLTQLVDTRNLILPEKHTTGYRTEGRNRDKNQENLEEIPFSSRIVPSGLSVPEEP